MSLLTGTLPTAVEICGRQVKIRADFRAGLAFERALGDETLDQLQRLALGLSVPVSYTHLDVYKRQAGAHCFHRHQLSAAGTEHF